MTGASGPRTGLPAMRRFDPKRLWALVRKESLQAIRDPSKLLIAFALPVVLLLLFSYSVSLDLRSVRLGVVQGSGPASAQLLAAALPGTRCPEDPIAPDRRAGRQ